MDRDFELAWRAVPGSEPRAAVFTETVGGERYALVMFLPPEMSQPSGRPRELVLVIDRSGSMAGPSIRQARAALGAALDRLGPGDRFNVVAFGSDAKALFPQPEHAQGLALDTARAFVESLEAGGGTNIGDALALALRPGASERAAADGFLRQVVFITDGSVDNEEALLSAIDDGLGESRLFTVGIGPAPNGYFMRKAAAFGRGSFTHVGDMREIADKMGALLRKLEAPALTDIQLRWPDGALAQATPARIPDLYAGEPVVVSARLDGAADAVRITGGMGWERRIAVEADASPGIGVLFARARIAEMMDERLRAADRAPIEAAITDLALRHHIVSRFTSLVAVDRTPTRPAGFEASRGAVPTPAPAIETAAAFAAMPVGATNAQAWMLMGAIFIVIPLLLTYGWRE